MKRVILFINFYISFFLVKETITYHFPPLWAQGCPNANFSQNNFNGWQGFTGYYGNPFQTPGIVSGRHTIINPPGNDPICGGITFPPPGGGNCMQLGNSGTGAQAEAVRYSLTVDPSNALFIYNYAVVLEDPGHAPNEQPTFNLRILDQNNNLIDPTCGEYSVFAGQPGSNFQSCGGGVTYQNWTTVGLDLSPYIGQTITLEFVTRDCSLGGHFGYAYLSASCSPLILDVTYCPGDNSALIEAPAGFANYSWSTGQSGPNVSSITIPNPQTNQQVTVTMTSVISNQCNVTLSTNLYPTIPTAQFTYTPACPGDPTIFNDQSFTNNNYLVNQWQWDFGDGNTSNLQNPQHTYANPGTYLIELIVTTQNGCRDTIQMNVNSLNAPIAGFTAPSVCYGLPVNFTDQSVSNNNDPIQSWQWNFGDGNTSNQQNPTNTYTSANNYNVTLTVSNSEGCTDTETQSITIYDKPVANFNFTNECEGNPITFTDQSTSQAPTVVNYWQWDMHALDTLYIQNPQYAFNQSGNYNVTLVVGATSGCYDTITLPLTVYDYPSAQFTANNVCDGVPVNFTDQSTIANGFTITDYQWNFGDGNNNSGQNQQYTYANPGIYQVVLSVTGDGLCTSTISQNVTVYDLPQPGFSTQDECLYNAAAFTNNTPQPQYDTIANYYWDFGDGNTGNNENETHQYNQPGTYQVSLTAFTSSLNCSNTITLPITIHPGPNANFNFTNDCQIDGIQFNDQSNISSGNINNYSWNFGDNNTSNVPSPLHYYNTDGQYQVSLIVYSDQNCTDTSTQTVTVYPMPNANFSALAVCHESPTPFTDLSTVNQPDQVIGWQWNFDGNGQSQEQNPSYVFSQPGTSNTTLIVTTNHGCKDTITLPVIIHPNPVVDFTADILNGCSPVCVTLTSQSNVATGNISQLIWTLEDGSTLNGSPANICFTNPSVINPNYETIMLTAITDQGCTKFLEKQDYITVYPKPIAEFYPNPDELVLYETASTMINLSQGANQWNWEMGDGTTYNYFQPTHIYTDSGTYYITLTVSNEWGCMDTVVKQITIKPSSAIYVPNTFTPNGDKLNDFFTAEGFGIKEFTMEIFDRWGLKLFETTKMDIGWDGTYGDKECQIDVYVYQITAIDIFNKKHIYRGQVNLVR